MSSAPDPPQHLEVEAAAGEEEVQPVGLRDQLSAWRNLFMLFSLQCAIWPM